VKDREASALREFLQASKYIDWGHPDIVASATALSQRSRDPIEIARSCFEFVRDEVRHSLDFQMNPVTCKASDVLKYRTGYCYAKSHLLVALLRANGIPAGLCYQRLIISSGHPSYCLHGLVAAYLEPYGWYRIDPRGNKTGVNSEFCPPIEKLAFMAAAEGEADLPEIWAEPLQPVVRVLESYKNYVEVADNLPDVQLIGATGLRVQ
jgi:transglutaminase-like putative cysteine protease